MIKRLLFFLVFFVSIQAYSQCPLSISVDSVSCAGGSDGSITITPSVAGYYEYNLQIWNTTMNIWTPFGTIYTGLPSYTFFNLPSDSFRVLVEDTLLTTPPTGCALIGVVIPQPPPLDAGANGTIPVCENSPTFDLFPQLNGTPDVGGSWSENGNPVSNMFNPSTYGAGVYTLTYTIDLPPCIPVSADVIVTVNAIVDAGGNGTHTVCENSPVFNLFNHLTGSPDVGGVWTDAIGMPVPNIFNPSTSGSGTFVFTYTVLAHLHVWMLQLQ